MYIRIATLSNQPFSSEDRQFVQLYCLILINGKKIARSGWAKAHGPHPLLWIPQESGDSDGFGLVSRGSWTR